jgi:acyl-CoA thioesterase
MISEKIIRDVFESAPFLRFIGMELIELGEGEATVGLKMREELQQPHELMHGGVIASLIDTATAFANVTTFKEGEKAVTIDLNVHFLRPVSEGEITCIAKIVKAGRRISTISAEVFNEDKKIIATALSTYTKI